jgi:hypothetical protein
LYCRQDNDPGALVCASCSRDIAAPASLLTERDNLLRKRDVVRDELRRTREQIDAIKNRKRGRSA